MLNANWTMKNSRPTLPISPRLSDEKRFAESNLYMNIRRERHIMA